MTDDWLTVDAIMHQALDRVFPASVLLVKQHRHTVLHRAYGFLNPETRQEPTQPDTIFDLASVTKLFTATAFMRLVETREVRLDQPVVEVLPEFSGLRPIHPYADPLHPGQEVAVVPPTDETVDAGGVTFHHLLTHTSGLPGWSPFYQLDSRQAVIEAALHSDFSCPTGSYMVYSDLGFMLLGEAVAHVTAQPLDAAIHKLVLAPLGLSATCYRPIRATDDHPLPPLSRPTSNIAPTEHCAWRKRRLRGEVDDENAARLGGVAGHAGLFSSAVEVAALGQTYLDGGGPLLRPQTVVEMTRLQAEDGSVRRGLGWQLWSPDPTSNGYPFSERAYGHTGFTGTSLWVDPKRELVVVLLTNRVYYGRDPALITALRPAVHDAVCEAISSRK